MENFVQADRNQPYLLPPDLREWLPEDDLAHFVVAAVERVPLSDFVVNSRGTGSAQYPPRMMLALLIYCYANGIFSSRRIERATYRDIGVRYVTANTHPDHDTVCKFRRGNLAAVQSGFVEVLLLAKELKLLTVGRVSVDGTRVQAAASKRRSIRYDRALQLRAEVKDLLAEAERADGKEAAESLVNLTDADSGLMRRNQRSEYRQAYNAQAVVDADGSQLVLVTRVSRCRTGIFPYKIQIRNCNDAS